MAESINVCRRVEIHAGWVAKLQGRRNVHAAIQREIESLNADGYRVVWIHPDSWGLLRTLWGFFVWLWTLGFFASQPGILIVGERMKM